MKVNAILPDDLLGQLDKLAKKKHTSRSGLLREAAEKMILEHLGVLAARRRKQRAGKATVVHAECPKGRIGVSKPRRRNTTVVPPCLRMTKKRSAK